MSSTPAATVDTPTPTRATVVDTSVATSTPTRGASMNVISVPTESRANAVRCWTGGTRTPSDCRTTEKTGTRNSPPTNATTTRAS
jgi:hypothetical protein